MRISPLTPEAQPVAAISQLTDVADWTAAEAVGQVEDLRDGQDRALERFLVSGTANTAGVADEDFVLLDGRHEDGSQQAVCLGRDGFRHSTGEQVSTPLADHGGRELGQAKPGGQAGSIPSTSPTFWWNRSLSS
ncbi:MAG: hypothetical protein J2P30_06530 [Actinobacteria bacterium]|nr:hypothetical protein [Actinomycetota bacterium]